MLPIIKELIIVEGVNDQNIVKQTVKATVFSVGGWSVKKKPIIEFIQKAEKTNKGLIFLLDSDETGTKIENFLLRQLELPEKAITTILPEDLSSTRKGKVGIEHAKPKDILKALQEGKATFLDSPPERTLFFHDMIDLEITGGKGANKKRSLLANHFRIPPTNAKTFLELANFLDIKKQDLEAILNNEDHPLR